MSKQHLSHESTREQLNDIFVGRTVTVINGDMLELDDGTMLTIHPNEGGLCGCGSYDITELNGCDNIITGSKLVETPGADDSYTWRLFVYSGHQKINLLTVEGADGTGMYGTGFVIYVHAPKGS